MNIHLKLLIPAILIVAVAGGQPTLAAESTADGIKMHDQDRTLLESLVASGRDTDELRGLISDLGASNTDTRARAVQLLWDRVGESSLPTMIRMTRDPEDNVALVATRVLLDSPTEEAQSAIRAALSAVERSPSLKAQVISTISERSDTRFISATGALLSSENPDFRRLILRALQGLGTPECLPFFMAATADGDLRVSTTAVHALAKLGDPAALPRVALLLDSDQDSLVTAAAAAIPALGGTEKYSARLKTLLEGGSGSLTGALLSALQNHPSPAAVPLIARVASSEDRSIRVLVAQALEANRTAEAEKLLIGLLKDPDQRVRSVAVKSLGDWGDVARLPDLVALAEDPSSRVRASLALALGKIGSAKGFPTLKRLFADQDLSVKLASVSASGEIGGDGALPLLKSGSADPDPYIRMEAVRGLAAQNTPAATTLIRECADDADMSVRITAITELGRLRDTDSEEILKAARQDQAEAVRNAARTALAMLNE